VGYSWLPSTENDFVSRTNRGAAAWPEGSQPLDIENQFHLAQAQKVKRMGIPAKAVTDERKL
jgi:hypothetical protein